MQLSSFNFSHIKIGQHVRSFTLFTGLGTIVGLSPVNGVNMIEICLPNTRIIRVNHEFADQLYFA